jgi:hypothetical protein
VNARDAFGSGMDFMGQISDEQAELLLSDPRSGEGEGPELSEIASLLRALPAAIPVRPDPAVEAPLVERLAATARSATHEAHGAATAQIPAAAPVRPWRRRLVVFARVAIAVTMVPAALAGLAIAGVSLPEPAREAFERLGIELPNQAGPDDGVATGEEENGGFDEDERDGSGAGNAASGVPGKGAHGASAANGGHPGSSKGKRSHGKGKGGKAHSQGDGPAATPPGHGATPPGQGGVPPGNEGVPPGGGSDGSVGPPPDAGPSATPPGHGGTPPGQAKSP